MWRRHHVRRHQVVGEPPRQQRLRHGHEQQEVHAALGAARALLAPALRVRVVGRRRRQAVRGGLLLGRVGA